MPTDTHSSFFNHPAAPWLLFGLLPRFSGKRWLAVCEAFADPLEFLSATTATHKSFGVPPDGRAILAAWQRQDPGFAPLAEIMGVFRQCEQQGIDLLGWGDHRYPEALRHIPDAPAVLYVRGRPELLTRPQIAIVGSRNATRGGLDHAYQFAGALSDRGYVITSGLALGIDGSAHAGALAVGGDTVAVVGTGVDVLYPPRHKALTEQIVERGTLVSELPPGTGVKPGHFPRRNRIISGLSRGILVVEASLRSGSLITARLALEQGREVFAIPGSIHNPLARGCHELIRQGARLVETVDDIEEELTAWWSQPQPEAPPQRPARSRLSSPGTVTGPEPKPKVADLPAQESLLPEHLDDREIAVLEALGYDSRSTDQLCSATGLPADQLMQSLLLLEMEGLVASAPGGFQRLS